MKPKTKYSEHETAAEHSCCESIFFSNNYNSKFSFGSILNNVSTSQFSSGGFTYKINEIIKRVSQGFWGTREHWQNIEGNKGTLADFWEQGNKIRKITVRKHSQNVWEHGNIGQFWKGTREQGTPLGDPQ